ncbi:MAG: hypothetical protein OK454_06495 [Thaumarchaeota archaeon]|nr:hypothetical protein [Nitrososphaerota archaeon]
MTISLDRFRGGYSNDEGGPKSVRKTERRAERKKRKRITRQMG